MSWNKTAINSLYFRETPQYKSCHTNKFTNTRCDKCQSEHQSPRVSCDSYDGLPTVLAQTCLKFLYVSGGGADHPKTPAAMLTAKTDLLLFQHN